MKIDRVYIACYKHDLRLARILATSIRHWYPDLPIWLIKDRRYGDFDTRELESVLKVSVLPTRFRSYGWGFAKLEPYFLAKQHRCLILDADIVMLGCVIDHLEQFNEDFVVAHEVPPDLEFIDRWYFNLDRMRDFDPEFKFPGFIFNTGNLVATTGILQPAHFAGLIEWKDLPSLSHPQIFRCAEQGVLNYLLMKMHARGEISLRRDRFMEVPFEPPGMDVDVAKLNSASPYKFVVHWAGCTRNVLSPTFARTPRGDLMLHFEDLYYRHIPMGSAWRWCRLLAARTDASLREFLKQIPGVKALRRLFGG